MFTLEVNLNKFIKQFPKYQNAVSSNAQVNYDELSQRIDEAIDMANSDIEIVPIDFAKNLKAIIQVTDDAMPNEVSLRINNFEPANKQDLQNMSNFLVYFFYSELSGVNDIDEDEFYEDWYQTVDAKII